MQGRIMKKVGNERLNERGRREFLNLEIFLEWVHADMVKQGGSKTGVFSLGRERDRLWEGGEVFMEDWALTGAGAGQAKSML